VPLSHQVTTRLSNADALSGGFKDKPRNRVGIRDHRDVARFQLNRLRAHALGHEPFEVGIDRPVLRGKGLEAGFGSPGGVGRLAGQKRLLERLLDRVERASPSRRNVPGKVPQECLFA
jgi:hypothetical protein